MAQAEEAIIFFDKLGFGWVIDRRVLKHVKLAFWQRKTCRVGL